MSQNGALLNFRPASVLRIKQSRTEWRCKFEMLSPWEGQSGALGRRNDVPYPLNPHFYEMLQLLKPTGIPIAFLFLRRFLAPKSFITVRSVASFAATEDKFIGGTFPPIKTQLESSAQWIARVPITFKYIT